MATIQVCCRYCTSEQVIKNGSNKQDGHQRYRCQNCKRSFQLQYTYNAYLPTIKETIVQMAMNGSGIRDTVRVLNIDAGTVLATLKKRAGNRKRQSSVLPPAGFRNSDPC